MQRFYFSSFNPTPALTIREDSFVHQISKVLRSKPGDQIVLFNGDGIEYIYEMTTIAKKEVTLTLNRTVPNSADIVRNIRLYQALPNRYEKIEYILQKGTEVGISEFTFFPSERSQKLVINERKIERFKEIVREALEQCGGNCIPKLVFQDSRESTPVADGMSIFLHTDGKRSMKLTDLGDLGRKDSINIFVGPEGGWSDTEVEIFRKQ